MKIQFIDLLLAAGLSAAITVAQTPPADEMILNGSFEPAPAGSTDIPGWTFIKDGEADGSIAIDSILPLNDHTPHSLRIIATRLGNRLGMANSGSAGMNIQSQTWYDITFSARTQNNLHDGLVFSLESADGQKVYARTTLPEIGGNWMQYTLSLHPRGADPKARLVIYPIEPATMWLDAISMTPRKE